MKQLLSILMLVGIAALPTINTQASSASKTEPGLNTLKQNVAKSFVKKANDPKTKLHQSLLKFNQDKSDGRNQNGVLPTNLSASSIQVISLSGEDQFGSYCQQISNKPGHAACSNGVTESYLVLIPYKMGVHKAVEYDTLQFIVNASKKAEWKLDQNQKEYDRKETVKIDEPVKISVKPSN